MKVRAITEDDSRNYIDLCEKLDQETKFMMLEPDERTITVDEQKNRIQSLLSNENSMIFVAEDNGELVGYLGAYGGNVQRIKHRVHIVVGILQAYTGRGIGTGLFNELEKWSMQVGIQRMELTVMAHNEIGLALYKKMGFSIEGIARDSMFVDGKYVDEYYMAKTLPYARNGNYIYFNE